MGRSESGGEVWADFAGGQKDRGDLGAGGPVGGEEGKEEKNAGAEDGARRADEVGFGILGRLGVKGEVAGVEGEEMEGGCGVSGWAKLGV